MCVCVCVYIYIYIYMYIYNFGCAGSSLLCRFFYSCGAQAFHYSGFSRGAQALGHTASVAVVPGL